MTLTHLPEKPVKLALVSGEFPWLAQELRVRGIDVITTVEDRRLPKPVCWHPDTHICAIDGKAVALKGSPLAKALSACGVDVEEAWGAPGDMYPNDALCNALCWGPWAVGNVKTVDKLILQKAGGLGLSWIPVNQGYAACSTALVDDHAAITADEGIARALESHGIEVLRIRPGFIELPGYGYGFLGGCCGKLSPRQMVFVGRIDSHPDGEKILRFLAARKIQTIELMNRPLLDVGGIIPLL